MINMLALNSLKQVDIIFFIVLGAVIALCVIVYFLIPVFNGFGKIVEFKAHPVSERL